MYTWCHMFLFFKQKTACEVRISDWSSDVCSSDLDPTTGGVARRTQWRKYFPFPLGKERSSQPRIDAGQVHRTLPQLQRQPRVAAGAGRAGGAGEIGSAAFRERWCQDV